MAMVVSSISMYCLLNDKKNAQNIWSKDIVHKKNLSIIESFTTWIPFNVFSRTIFKQLSFLNKIKKNDAKKRSKDLGRRLQF